MKLENSMGIFCPKCGSILTPKEGARKNKLACSRCTYISKDKEDVKLQEKSEKAKKIEIMDENALNAYPKIKAECSKCNNREAYFWTVQTRAGDEAETRFFECTKCKHRWREYS